jgi:hypothetical protein
MVLTASSRRLFCFSGGTPGMSLKGVYKRLASGVASVTAVMEASRPAIVTRGGVKPRFSPARISSICS